MPEAQQRVGGCFLSLMPQMKTLYLAYCANHPSAVSVLTEHRCVSWTSFQVGVGGPCPGVPSGQLISVKCYLKHGAGIVCFSRMVSLIILRVSAWGGLTSGFKILTSAYNRSGRVLQSPPRPGRCGQRSGELVGALEGGRGLVRAAIAPTQCVRLEHVRQSGPCCRRRSVSVGHAGPEAVRSRSAAGNGKQQQAWPCALGSAEPGLLGSREGRRA